MLGVRTFSHNFVVRLNEIFLVFICEFYVLLNIVCVMYVLFPVLLVFLLRNDVYITSADLCCVF